ncbi:hypothetical protein DHW03_17150 [Pedobacter yonginense]|uniref:Uncharacterized protein n=2 Tax=Pedobacter yonginense TaxID=651869 RepID=A0A317EJK6_9SPHI|nr:hypothetical protein DHW03_17150 [Pedobacter yonginense]
MFFFLMVKAQSSILGKAVNVTINTVNYQDNHLSKFSAVIDSLTKKALDSIKKSNSLIDKSEKINDSCRLKLFVQSEVMGTEKLYDLPAVAYGRFEYFNRISLYNGANNVLLMKTDDIYKDLPDLIINNINELYDRIHKILNSQLSIFVFSTQENLSSMVDEERNAIINFNGIDSEDMKIDQEKMINLLINNMLINQQNNFHFNYKANYPNSKMRQNSHNEKGDIINLNIKVVRVKDNYVLDLLFKSTKELKFSQSVFGQIAQSSPVRLSFYISGDDVLNGCYTDVIFDINKSLYKFLLFNLEPKK